VINVALDGQFDNGLRRFEKLYLIRVNWEERRIAWPQTPDPADKTDAEIRFLHRAGRIAPEMSSGPAANRGISI